MGEFRREQESNHGLSLVLLSNSDLKTFPKNIPSDFENVFKTPVKLDQNKSYDVVLANLHCPSYQNTLVKNDNEGSYIQYNIGMFNYNHKTREFELEKKSVTPLWKSVPSTSIAGIAFEKELSEKDNNNMSDGQEDFKSRVSWKARHLKLIDKLGSSLILDKNMDFTSQSNCMKVYGKAIQKFNLEVPSGGLMARYSYGDNTLQFPNFNKLPHYERYKLITNLITLKRRGSISNGEDYRYDMRTVMHLNTHESLKRFDGQYDLLEDDEMINHISHTLDSYPVFKNGGVTESMKRKRVDDNFFRETNMTIEKMGNLRFPREVVDKRSRPKESIMQTEDSNNTSSSSINVNETELNKDTENGFLENKHEEDNTRTINSESPLETAGNEGSENPYKEDDTIGNILESPLETEENVDLRHKETSLTKTLLDLEKEISSTDEESDMVKLSNDDPLAYKSIPARGINFRNITKPIVFFFITFGDRMREFLNIENEMILVAYAGFAIGNPLSFNQIISPNFAKKLVHSLLIYSNMVAKTVRVGDHMTNLLDIVTFGKNINSKTSALHVYKPISHHYFDSATVAITDEDGCLISFPDNLYSALEIVVRSKD